MLHLSFVLFFLTIATFMVHAQENKMPSALNDEQLVAWCVVPFDSKQRGPEARAKMLKELGLKRCAYDWREKHVPEFEEEILQYQQHGIEFFAFWGEHEKAFQLFQKHQIRPQIWKMLPQPSGDSQKEKIEQALASIMPLINKTSEMGCKLGLYNHGGWSGEPTNLVSLCQALRESGHQHVGIVYNWHHGHDHIDDWKEMIKLMKPYLHCLNLNGMNTGAEPKILPLAQGKHELAMLKAVIDSGYQGPIGILDHQSQFDTKEVLEDNLKGLHWLKAELIEPGSGGPKPKPTTSKRSS